MFWYRLMFLVGICLAFVSALGAAETKPETPVKPAPAVTKPEVKPETPVKPAPAVTKPEVKPEPLKKDAVPAVPAHKAPPAADHAHKGGKPYVEQLDQEEQRRLMKLYQDDPAAYYTELGKIIGQLRKEEAELNKKLADAVNDYRQESNPEAKKKLLENVKSLTKQQFYFRLNETGTRLKDSEQRLALLRKLYETRKKNAAAIIDKRVQYLISDPSQRW